MAKNIWFKATKKYTASWGTRRGLSKVRDYGSPTRWVMLDEETLQYQNFAPAIVNYSPEGDGQRADVLVQFDIIDTTRTGSWYVQENTIDAYINDGIVIDKGEFAPSMGGSSGITPITDGYRVVIDGGSTFASSLTVRALGNDALGARADQSWSFSVLESDLGISNESPTGSDVEYNTQISFDITDTTGRVILENSLDGYLNDVWIMKYGEGIDGYSVVITEIEDGYNVEITLTDDLFGSYTIKAYGNTSIGDTTSSEWSFTTDTAAPYVESQSPANGSFSYDYKTLNITFNIKDDGRGVDQSTIDAYVNNVWILKNGATFVAPFNGASSAVTEISGGYAITIDKINDYDLGTVSIDAYADDLNKNSMTENWSFNTVGVEHQQTIVLGNVSAGVNGISLWEDRFIIGDNTDDTQGTNAGAAHIYKRTGESWALEQTIYGDDITDGYLFGYATDIHNDVCVVSTANVAAVYVFTRSGTTWTQQEKICPDTTSIPDLAIRTGKLLIGAPGANTNAGAVYYYKNSGGGWSLQQTITADGGAAGYIFGTSLEYDDENECLVVGHPNATVGAHAFAGEIQIFSYNSGTDTFNFEDSSGSSGARSNQTFGVDIAAAGGGTYAIASYPSDSHGEIYRFEYSPLDEKQEITPDGDGYMYKVAASYDGYMYVAKYVGAGDQGVRCYYDNGTSFIKFDEIPFPDGYSGGFGPTDAYGRYVVTIGQTSTDDFIKIYKFI